MIHLLENTFNEALRYQCFKALHKMAKRSVAMTNYMLECDCVASIVKVLKRAKYKTQHAGRLDESEFDTCRILHFVTTNARNDKLRMGFN